MKLWRLMESECHELDLELARLSTGVDKDSEVYRQYSKKIQRIRQLEEESERQREYAMRLDSACTLLAVRLGEEAEHTPLLQHLRGEAVDAQDHLQSLVRARELESHVQLLSVGEGQCMLSIPLNTQSI